MFTVMFQAVVDCRSNAEIRGKFHMFLVKNSVCDAASPSRSRRRSRRESRSRCRRRRPELEPEEMEQKCLPSTASGSSLRSLNGEFLRSCAFWRKTSAIRTTSGISLAASITLAHYSRNAGTRVRERNAAADADSGENAGRDSAVGRAHLNKTHQWCPCCCGENHRQRVSPLRS